MNKAGNLSRINNIYPVKRIRARETTAPSGRRGSCQREFSEMLFPGSAVFGRVR
jgi:hypothetical protein